MCQVSKAQPGKTSQNVQTGPHILVIRFWIQKEQHHATKQIGLLKSYKTILGIRVNFDYFGHSRTRNAHTIICTMVIHVKLYKMWHTQSAFIQILDINDWRTRLMQLAYEWQDVLHLLQRTSLH